MLKRFLKITGSKSAPASEDQLTKYKNETKTRDVWKADVAKLRAIVDDLRSAYERHKGDFALSRYEELKAMIKSSIERFNQSLADAGKTAMTSSKADGGATTRLKNHAEQLSKGNSADRGLTPDDLTKGQTLEAIEAVHRQTVRLKHEYRTLRDCLNDLSKEYTESKSMNPAQRYTVLKEMIKTVLAKADASF